MNRTTWRPRDLQPACWPDAPDDPPPDSDRWGPAPIICGVHDSDAARAAAETAAGLAALLGAPLVLVHVARPVKPRLLQTSDALDLRQAARLRDARGVIERVAEECALSPLAGVAILFGDPAERLAIMAARQRAWMIVVGSRRQPSRRWRAHGVTRRLSATASCPVVLVPA